MSDRYTIYIHRERRREREWDWEIEREREREREREIEREIDNLKYAPASCEYDDVAHRNIMKATRTSEVQV